MWKPIILTRDSIYMQYPSSWWRETWREALVSGNGHTGVSFYGGTKEQTLMITDGGLWYGGEANKLPDVHHALERMRNLEKRIANGKVRVDDHKTMIMP